MALAAAPGWCVHRRPPLASQFRSTADGAAIGASNSKQQQRAVSRPLNTPWPLCLVYVLGLRKVVIFLPKGCPTDSIQRTLTRNGFIIEVLLRVKWLQQRAAVEGEGASAEPTGRPSSSHCYLKAAAPSTHTLAVVAASTQSMRVLAAAALLAISLPSAAWSFLPAAAPPLPRSCAGRSPRSGLRALGQPPSRHGHGGGRLCDHHVVLGRASAVAVPHRRAARSRHVALGAATKVGPTAA